MKLQTDELLQLSQDLKVVELPYLPVDGTLMETNCPKRTLMSGLWFTHVC